MNQDEVIETEEETEIVEPEPEEIFVIDQADLSALDDQSASMLIMNENLQSILELNMWLLAILVMILTALTVLLFFTGLKAGRSND